MAVARDDFVVVAPGFVDGFRFCRRFDDDDFHVSVSIGARARKFLNARRRGCQGDSCPFRRVPVRAEAWRRRRLTSGIAAPVRQPRPAWVPIFPGSARTRRRYLPVRLQPAATMMVRRELAPPEPLVA